MFTGPATFDGRTELVAACVFIAALLLGFYLRRRGSVPAKTWDAKLAWQRAGIYFCTCLVIASFSGVLATVLSTPLATPEQLSSPSWILMTALCFGVIVVGYGVIWPIGTFNDGRRLYPLLALAYGFTWGCCQGLLFLSFWSLAELTGLGVWWVAGISYVAIGAWQGMWHALFWDKYVSPPHNYSKWNGRKVAFAHTPNLIVCLIYLALYGNAGIYVLLQGLALAMSAFVMRFPAPWDSYTAPAGLEK